uniref:TEP1-F n=1 Tax=Anopheles minimus TaxID=112268 RepID=A0A182W9H6_9DIPT
MWQFIRSRILTVIIFMGTAHGILVVGPRLIRANQNYTVVISHFKSNLSDVNLMLQMQGHTDDGTNVLNVTKLVNVREDTNKHINFNLPGNLPAGNYTITIDGQRGFSYHSEVILACRDKSISGLIQISKPVFKPGDTVQFRVIVLDSELKPPTQLGKIQVKIHDPDNDVIRKWSSLQLYTGVFENDFQIAPSSKNGLWKISVLVDGEELVSKTFEVKDYELSSFSLEVKPSAIPLKEHQGLNLTISAYYNFRKPVKGLAKVELYLEDEILDQKKELEMYGETQVELRYVQHFEMDGDQKDVRVKTIFIEQHSERTFVKEFQITVYKHKYRVDLINGSPQFQPGFPFKCALQFRNHDGTPAKGITGKVEVDDIDYETTATSDIEGLIELELHSNENTEKMSITFSNDEGCYFNAQLYETGVNANKYIKLRFKHPITSSRLLQFLVTCNEPMKFFVYYVVSHGKIVDSGFVRTDEHNKYSFRLEASEKMLPTAKIMIATVVNDAVLCDFVEIYYKEPHNNFNLSIDKLEVNPGHKIELRMSGRPGAYVGLAAHDIGSDNNKNQQQDPFWEDIMQLHNGFGSIVKNEFDKFHSMGLFVRTLDGIVFNKAHDKSARDGLHINESDYPRSNIQESWLWKNVTIGNSGTATITTSVPDTATSWNVTGFFIDPEYGLAIIKQPILLTTIKAFYIVENFPYSIRRDEAVELQFTLYNNLEEEHIADVTLYNVDNQTEFVGRPLEALNYTKSITVPPKVGVPISFLIKARPLGEMIVRVNASIKLASEMDMLEKVIRVTPESLTQLKKASQIFCYDRNINHSFTVILDVNSKADNGSNKLEVRFTPNMLTTVIKNLEDLLAVPSGNGEQNMFKLGSNLVLLDYLHSIGSKDQILIHKATNLLSDGYRYQMRYRQADGSFGMLQSGGSIFITTFVARSLKTALKYTSEVDASMIERAYNWLASKQHTSGKFEEVGTENFQDMQGSLRSSIWLTSYVVTALLEDENAKVKYASLIQNGISYLSSQLESINNPYDLSITTYALMLHGHSMKDKALEKLLNISLVPYNDPKPYWNPTFSIEAIAYALLSLVNAEKKLDCSPVDRWLSDLCLVAKYFPLTPDIVLGLTALSKLAEIVSYSRNDFFVQLQYKLLLPTTMEYEEHIHVNPQHNIINYELPENTKSVEITVAGNGFRLFEATNQYNLNLVNFEKSFLVDVVKQKTTSDDELRLQVCASFIPNWTKRRSNMALIEVTFPSGYVAEQSSIIEQTMVNTKKNNEIRYGGTSVIVYYDNMSREKNCFFVTAYRRNIQIIERPAYVVVYDYFDRSRNTIEMYELD